MSDKSKAEGMRFETLKAAGGDGLAARLGRLVLPQRQAVDTPNYFAVASRGVVPHLTPDNIARHSEFSGAYIAMEDMVEKSQKKVTRIPAVQRAPAADGKRLHAFTALPSSSVTILGPRRVPAVKAPIGNSDNYIQIFTSNGFQALRNPDYINAIQGLKPDIAIPMADIIYGQETTPQSKSLHRMCERTEEWMSEVHASLDLDELRSSNTSIFAPTLPAPYPMQWEYLNRLSDDMVDMLSGLAIYDVDILPDLANYPALTPLARLSVDAPATPHDILRQVALGVDAFLLPFINATSDAGVAMTFTFPAPTGQQPNGGDAAAGTGLLPLGTDLTDPENTTSLAPLTTSCTCYACAHHHRAYLHHLLDAREMLAWTLLQIHNHHAAAAFFAAVRASLAAGTFEDDRRAFGRAYESEFPAGMGTRPRARGYHFKSEGGDERRNKPSWGHLHGQGDEDKAAVAVAEKLAAGGVETPLVPDDGADAADLVRDGFAEIDINKAQAG